jgi:SAM-dependent methyltransferase
MEFQNAYQDPKRAASYAKLEFPGTYYLAYRDLPTIISEHGDGTRALDFGCGTGRSNRFLKDLGFDPIGVDVAEHMVQQARTIDPEGDYRVIGDGDFSRIESIQFDLILSVFTFDNIPAMENKVYLFRELAKKLTNLGIVVNVVSSPEIYVHEWASFSTKNYPENRFAKSGDTVRIVMTDVEDARPVEDILWSDEDYQKVFEQAGLKTVATYRPLARDEEPFNWINETRIPPWSIYVLRNP